MYLIGNKTTKKCEYISGAYGAGTREPSATEIINWYAAAQGAEPTNYACYHTPDTSETARRIMAGDSFDPVFDIGMVVDVDFTPEDAKRHIRFVVTDDKGNYTDTVKANGIDTLTVTAMVMDHARSNVDDTFDATIMVPIKTPDGRDLEMLADFTAGVCQLPFRTTNAGTWKIPQGVMIPNTNIKIGDDGYVLDIKATLVMF